MCCCSGRRLWACSLLPARTEPPASRPWAPTPFLPLVDREGWTTSACVASG